MQTLPTHARSHSKVSSTLLAVGMVMFALTVLALLAGQWMARHRTEVVVASPESMGDAQVVSQRKLRFEDGSDGGISVFDASSGQLVDVLRGEQGFVRGTLRGFARERRRVGAATSAPLWLQSLSDQRLVLHDPLSTHRVDLGAFGPDNAAAFARWLRHNPSPALRESPTQKNPLGRQP